MHDMSRRANWLLGGAALIVAVVLAVLALPGSAGGPAERASRGGDSARAPTSRDTVLNPASLKPSMRRALHARIRAAAKTVRRPVLRGPAPAWAKVRRDGSSNAGRHVNPVDSPGPRLRAAAVDRIVPDEFNGSTLDTSLWTFVNPIGDATLALTGSHAEITTPSGTRHDLWTGADEVPRLMQAAPNLDFEVQVKWDSAPTTGYQLQGILVQQDADDMLRIETHHDGGRPHTFVARIAGGTASTVHYGNIAGGAPIYMRVKREGSFWTVRTSPNGADWTTVATFTQNLAVSGIGPFAGNSGASPPAFTSRVDYFRTISAVPVDTTPPVISGTSAAPSAVGAVVSWQTNEPSSSSVVYGTDTSYSGGTVGNAALVSSHSVTVSGLRCGTLYHYAVRSRDAQGNEAASGDNTFTTGPCPTTIASDEFNAPELDRGVWTFANPLGDAQVALTGAHAELSVPAGRRHDLWTNIDEVPKLLQAAPDTDFEVEAKWDSGVIAPYQLQGIIVQQDADDMLRIETHHDGGGRRLFVARLAGGVASVIYNQPFQGSVPLYFRLKRQGNAWALRTSPDGDTWTTINFTQALAVTSIGPFAGNSGSTPPAFTSRIDYFRDVPPDRTAPAISAITSTPSGAAARVEWTTNEPAVSEIRYGRDTTYAAGGVSRATFTRQHSLVVHGLACNSTYHFQVRARDAAGNESGSPDNTVSTSACPQHVQSDEFNGTGVDTDKWTFVDPIGDSALQVTSGRAEISMPAGSRHDLWTGADEVPRLLQAAPDVDFEVEAKFDSAVSTGYQMQGIVVEQDADDLLRVETHNDGRTNYLFIAQIRAGVAEKIASRAIPASASFYLRVGRAGNNWTVRYSHDGAAWILGANFTSALNVTAVGPFAGNSGSSPPAFTSRIDYFREITDRTPPVISDVVVTPGYASAVVTWTTDEPASARILHGPTTSYGDTTPDPKRQTRHWTRVTNLSCGTAYHLQVRSADQLGNEAASGDRAFSTSACDAGGPDIDVWGGDTQSFGDIGIPQRWMNILGNVHDPQGTTSLRATLNGSNTQDVTIGPDGNRLERQGDFNVELNRDLLLPGDNEVTLTAVDAAGNSRTRTVTVRWNGLSAGAQPSANGPVLVVVAHGDDALLGMAGIIRRHRQAGRKVYVGVATNGDEPQSGALSGYCGAAAGNPSTTAARGLELSRETMTAVGLLGMGYSRNLTQTDLIFMGYPNDGLLPIARAGGAPWVGGGTGLGRTYGEDDDGSNASCDGELRYLLDGRHSQFTLTDMAADFDALLQLTAPSDIYTLADFDGHPDHAEVARQTAASVRRLGLSTRVHSTLVHPHESGPCMGFSAANWPNPAQVDNNPLSRFTPTIPFTSPPTPTCSAPTGQSWGPLGPPTESVEVPGEMQLTNPQQNLKWRTLNVWDTQCPPDNPAHVTCGYFNAFAKKNEFFWDRTFRGQAGWPIPYVADWDSTATIDDKSQVVEGQWRYESSRDGVRPLATGFDRLLNIGQFDWKSYEVEVPMIFHWFDSTKESAGAGVILGWQGHTDYANRLPRLGHPYGGICGFGRSFAEPSQPRLELIRNSGTVQDTIVAHENPPRAITLDDRYTMRFRRVDLGNGQSRYSCRFWKASDTEPGTWDLEFDLPDQLNTSAQFRGSALLMAHNLDITFGDVKVIPLG